MSLIQRFLRDRQGATAIEYGLIAAVLSLAVAAGVGSAADAIEFLFGSNESRLRQALDTTYN
ncbi:MAG TPA: Flp family type IVb pilin [Mesorhizobium sp.]|jgi:pilus assembly protein Flp/PilA|nr:Flp family type IVb pilin [Mesorhizobium sp.]